MNSESNILRWHILIFLLSAVFIASIANAQKKDPPEKKSNEGKATVDANPFNTELQEGATEHLKLEVGQTKLIHISQKVIRISVADPNVADVQVVTPKQVLVTAKSVGYSHLIMWGSDNIPLVVAVSVTKNLDNLRSQFSELFPDEKIIISSVGDLIVLSGTVSDLRLPARAAEVAKLHTERLANLIKVSGDQQVQLDVRFAEVSRNGMRKAGLNFLWQDSDYVAGQAANTGLPGQYLREIPGTGAAGGPPFVPTAASSDSYNLFFSTGLSQFSFSTILSILAQEGLAKMLAEPTLVAMSGQEAEFHAGGELPILLAEQLGQISIDFKKFGVRLKFTPSVLGERSMSLKLYIEVSEPDPSVGVVVSGFQVPGFKTRSSETTIRLKDGQSFAIAGLLSDSTRSSVSKVPVLGDIPILGMLFRSTAYQRDETELLMIVTGHLVKPLTPDEVPLMPGEDEFNDPNDFELFLLGSLKTKKKEKYKNEDDDVSAEEDISKTAIIKDEKSELEGPLGPIGFMRN